VVGKYIIRDSYLAGVKKGKKMASGRKEESDRIEINLTHESGRWISIGNECRKSILKKGGQTEGS